jgi:hypothetical protein
MTTISLAAIRAASDIKDEVVSVPEWGDNATVLVRGITKKQASDIFEACTIDGESDKDGKPTKTVDAKKLQDELWLACVVEPKFEREDLAILEEKANAPVTRVGMACLRVSGLDKDAYTKAKS